MTTLTVFVLVALVANVCGAPQLGNYFNTRIINGEDAAPGEFPYIVSLRDKNNGHFCGGSILNANWILTAAHCFTEDSANTITVVSGTTTPNADGNRNNVSRAISHEAYDPSHFWRNDIGLLQLSSPLTFSSNVQPIKLPAQDQAAAGGLSVIVSGWGLIAYPSGPQAKNLQKLALNLVTNEECQSLHPGATIYETSVCASAGNGKGPCSSDSGGPLVSSADEVLVGIVSWAMGCATGVPDVYTRVARYINWINQNVE